MYVLFKIFQKKEYVESFVNGELYLNSLNYFRNFNQIGTHINQIQGQGAISDCYEGTVLGIQKSLFQSIIPNKYIRVDPFLELVEFGKCHLLCFYRSDLIFNNKKIEAFRIPPFNLMDDFGDTVVIIKNVAEFINRVINSIKAFSKTAIYIFGNVEYKNPTINGTILYPEDSRIKKSSIIMKCTSDNENIPSIANVKTFLKDLPPNSYVSYRDCFVKNKNYEFQNEWRCCIYDIDKLKWNTLKPIQLNVGDLSDIVVICNKNDLLKTMNKLMDKNQLFPMELSNNNMFGNISRANFKKTVINNNPSANILFEI